MKISRVKTERWHTFDEGDCSKPLKGNGQYFKKGFWKKYDRKKFLKKILKQIDKND